MRTIEKKKKIHFERLLVQQIIDLPRYHLKDFGRTRKNRGREGNNNNNNDDEKKNCKCKKGNTPDFSFPQMNQQSHFSHFPLEPLPRPQRYFRFVKGERERERRVVLFFSSSLSPASPRAPHFLLSFPHLFFFFFTSLAPGHCRVFSFRILD